VSSLVAGFVRSYREHPNRPALEVGGRVLTYADLMRESATIANALERNAPRTGPPLTAVFGRRSKTAYAGVLAALLRGHGYVPLNPLFPPERTQLMLVRSQCCALVVDDDATSQLPQILDGVDRRLLVVLPDDADVGALRRRFRTQTFMGSADLETVEAYETPDVDDEALAYLLFTSGSTGTPKGVAVAHRNVRAYLDYMTSLYGVHPEDRVSQLAEMTFDASVFDIWLPWERAACLCCPSDTELRRVDRFIRGSAISICFSVPSAAIVLQRLGLLREDRFPSLRVTVFCGEPLPGDVASAWAAAAPNSIVENLYGPTELTVSCTRYRWTDTSPHDVHLGLVPIGFPHPGMDMLIVDEETLRPVNHGEAGELLMTGAQMTLGYWDDPERTDAAYVIPPGESRRFYRTGDRVDRRSEDGLLRYLGRVDHQIKVRGYRVELGEVEAAVREESGLQAVVAVGWPRTESGVSGIEVFVEGVEADLDGLPERLGRRLPYYMIPRRIHLFERLPLNANGKFDRHALVARLEAKQ